MKVKSLSHVWLFTTPWIVAYQAPWSMGFSRQEYWKGLPFPSPGIFLTQGWNLGLLHCRRTLYRLSHQGSIFLLRVVSPGPLSLGLVMDFILPLECGQKCQFRANAFRSLLSVIPIALPHADPAPSAWVPDWDMQNNCINGHPIQTRSSQVSAGHFLSLK